MQHSDSEEETPTQILAASIQNLPNDEEGKIAHPEVDDMEPPTTKPPSFMALAASPKQSKTKIKNKEKPSNSLDYILSPPEQLKSKSLTPYLKSTTAPTARRAPYVIGVSNPRDSTCSSN